MSKKFKFVFLKIIIIYIVCTNIKCTQDLTATIPSYITIETFDYDGNTHHSTPYPNTHNSTNITDVWITMNGQALGAFEIPCKIPILDSGSHSFIMYPGIKVNGIAGNRIKYPFYRTFTTDTIIVKDETITISPTTSYINQVVLDLNPEGQFELAGNGTILEASSISDTNAIIQDQVVFQGNKSAAIYLDSINSYFDIRNIEPLDLKLNTFLEVNFKSNIRFNVGLIIINNSEMEEKKELIQLYATENWKKIYLDLTPLISMGNMFSQFKIYFEGYYDETHIHNAVYLDNIKLISSK